MGWKVKKNVYIAVSTDPVSSYQDVVEYAKSMQDKADFLHCDIMDGKFVEKTTYDFALIKNVNANSLIPLDVHLMVLEPSKQIQKYIDAGANIITLHYEAFEDKQQLVEAIDLIKKQNVLVGISLKPETPFKEIRTYCFNIDLILVMSVEPGLSGQKFLNSAYNKIKEIADFREENKLNFKIEVDGGVNDENANVITDLGADILVSGSYVYKSPDRLKAIEKLKGN